MAIDKQELHDILYDNLKNYSDSDAYKNDMENPLHMEIMAKTMQSYFEKNIEITYNWSAANPSSGAPDPVIFFKSAVKYTKWDLTKPMTLEGLALKIMTATASGIINHPIEFLVIPGSFLIKPLILQKHTIAEECLMKCIVEPVCNWIKTLINPAPLSGTHTVFAGATTGMAIQ